MKKDSIGKIIRVMRKAAGMSQMRLARKIGVSYQQLQKYETGATKMSVPRLVQFAEAFSVPITALLGEDGGSSVKQAAQSNLSEDEARLLMLYRRIRRKKLKSGVLNILQETVELNT